MGATGSAPGRGERCRHAEGPAPLLRGAAFGRRRQRSPISGKTGASPSSSPAECASSPEYRSSRRGRERSARSRSWIPCRRSPSMASSKSSGVWRAKRAASSTSGSARGSARGRAAALSPGPPPAEPEFATSSSAPPVGTYVIQRRAVPVRESESSEKSWATSRASSRAPKSLRSWSRPIARAFFRRSAESPWAPSRRRTPSGRSGRMARSSTSRSTNPPRSSRAAPPDRNDARRHRSQACRGPRPPSARLWTH